MNSTLSQPIPPLSEFALLGYMNFCESFAPNKLVDAEHEAFCPYIAGELLRQRALIDRYAYPVETLEKVFELIAPSEWPRIVKLANESSVNTGKDGTSDTSIFKCHAPVRWCDWLDYRVVYGQYDEDQEPKYEEIKESEIEAAWAVSEELDRCTLMIHALKHIEAGAFCAYLPGGKAHFDYSDPALEYVRRVRIHLEVSTREFIASSNILRFELWKTQAHSNISLITHNVRQKLWLSYSFRNSMQWTAQPRVPIAHSEMTKFELPNVLTFKSVNSLNISPDGWAYTNVELTGWAVVEPQLERRAAAKKENSQIKELIATFDEMKVVTQLAAIVDIYSRRLRKMKARTAPSASGVEAPVAPQNIEISSNDVSEKRYTVTFKIPAVLTENDKEIEIRVISLDGAPVDGIELAFEGECVVEIRNGRGRVAISQIRRFLESNTKTASIYLLGIS
jgi:hypothetical protein